MTKVRLQDALAWVGDTFDISLAESNVISLQLIEVKDKGSGGAYEQFSFMLKGGGAYFLNQGVYEIQHHKLGTVYWMLVPVGKTDDGHLYEAAFNVLKEQ